MLPRNTFHGKFVFSKIFFQTNTIPRIYYILTLYVLTCVLQLLNTILGLDSRIKYNISRLSLRTRVGVDGDRSGAENQRYYK